MLALSGLREGRARGVLPLQTVQLLVPKTLATNSCVPITSKLIENKPLQVLHSGHLRKTGGRGCYQFCQRLFRSPSFPRSFPPISTLASLFFNHLRTLSFSVSHLYPIPTALSALFAKNQGVYPLRSYNSSRRSPPPIKKPLLCAPPQRTLRLCGESLFSFLACPP